jgi:hypothetical protein
LRFSNKREVLRVHSFSANIIHQTCACHQPYLRLILLFAVRGGESPRSEHGRQHRGACRKTFPITSGRTRCVLRPCSFAIGAGCYRAQASCSHGTPGADFSGSPYVPSLVLGIRTPRIPLLHWWEKGVGGNDVQGWVLGKPLCSFSCPGHQDTQTPPSPLVGEEGRGDEGQKRLGIQQGKRASGERSRARCPRSREESQGGARASRPRRLIGQVFRKARRAISRFKHQDARSPPSPLVGEEGRGDEGQKRLGIQQGKRASGERSRARCPRSREESQGGARASRPRRLIGQVFRKARRAISRFKHQDARSPPSPLVGEEGRGDEGQKRTGAQQGKRASRRGFGGRSPTRRCDRTYTRARARC